ncbi:hypothetical protein AciM339_0710 [Aciduliprofundum sp. MAR08-339]|uniref:hypothetical protein n=1 Tax=Aciduliprofundum sp. (strain MAR08-339) TaxID=673860 RepID=UPI0002A49B36|nr:hypothetical protein AciM339_0710 [Aciduliprofundum sp. MAR08-339]
MNDTSKDVLKFMYDKLYDELKKSEKLKQKSVLISLIEMKSNRRFEMLLKSSAVKGEGIGKLVRDELINQGYIIKILDADTVRYILSGKGIWYIEKDILGIDGIVSYLDRKFFGEYKKVPNLTNKEKVILWTLISVGAFFKDQAIDLKRDDYSKDKIKEVLNKSLSFLKQFGVVPKNFSEKELYGKPGNEHPVSHLIRHTDKLPKKTLGIYKVDYPQKYYLNLYEQTNNSFDQDGLAYLYSLIFKNKLEHIKEQAFKFVKEIYNEYNIYIFPEISISLWNMKEYLEDSFHKYILHVK